MGMWVVYFLGFLISEAAFLLPLDKNAIFLLYNFWTIAFLQVLFHYFMEHNVTEKMFVVN